MLPKNTNGVAFTSTTEFNRKVTIMKPSLVADDNGTPVAPEVFATGVPAKIRSVPNKGRPDTQEQITQAVAYFIVTIRYRTGITDDMTLFGPSGQTWVISSIDNPDFANRELRLTVREINGGQG
jgi:head-tail adaptor